MSNKVDVGQNTFLEVYKNTVLLYSQKTKKKLYKKLKEEGRITFDSQMSIQTFENDAIFCDDKSVDAVLSKAVMTPKLTNFFEEWEYIKMYKYSVPVFFETRKDIGKMLENVSIKKFNMSDFLLRFDLQTSLDQVNPLWYEKDGKYFIKFVLKKSFYDNENNERVCYRYPIVIFFDVNIGVLEIRYDAVKYYRQQEESNFYENLVDKCLKWVIETLEVKCFLCEYPNIIDIINDKNDHFVRMYKQMMDLKSGGSAELKTAEEKNAVLPFVGELRELIEENKDIFNEEASEILNKYLDDIEATASYPYIYIKLNNIVESQSYIVRITFDYLSHKYTLLQHLIGSCNNIEMERMNNAIKYLCESSSFTKGEEIKY